ncbi:MAG: methylenetetrahydrofolate--tRNA-(uracil(54)-C(5))-methyltransferase (FADH(2)-oxidizing) TrmFO [Candidatus Hydrogenedentota bacterium]|nr:MAG: methylenetetrahydrofolate--tRNA-(uracil(54)-C(5))-methyltransferase (FADH(2)-oxidizing) TrmFO [Candidatus Hydrogenedentota bacterium]
MSLTVIGGGLAGCEAAWQAASRGRNVDLYEMRPKRMTPAHTSGDLAELVCSNSFRSEAPSSAVGALKSEMKVLHSLVLAAAEASRVPAGKALAVDRTAFARFITSAIESHPRIRIHRDEITLLPEKTDTIIATGPLTSPALTRSLIELLGTKTLSFYDAIAPIVDATTIEPSRVFRQSRYDGTKDGDYLNVSLTESEYSFLVDFLRRASVRSHLPELEKPSFFEGCLPIEEMARRGEETLRFGPLKPVGLTDPRTNERPYAVIQLRRESLHGELYNLVGFQTQLSIPDQKTLFRSLFPFRSARFARYGSAHRNTYLDSPRLLAPDLSVLRFPRLRFAGQISGVEGYVESAASGLLAGILAGGEQELPPVETVLGGLVRYITTSAATPFQPMKANWGLVPEPPGRLRKRERNQRRAEISTAAVQNYARRLRLLSPLPS